MTNDSIIRTPKRVGSLARGSEIRVAKSAMTDRIYAGRVCKDGQTWRAGKRDVTSDVLKAVVDLITPGHALTVSADGKPAYEITVKALSPNNKLTDAPNKGPSPER